MPSIHRGLSLTISRAYSLQHSVGDSAGPSRKQITVANDDGRIRWGDLSSREKAARTAQQTFNLGVIMTGLLMTGSVVFLLYTEVFALDSKTSQFNRAVDQIRADSRVTELLGPGKKIKAYGEPTWSSWARSRPIASKKYRDASEAEHLTMHFNVEGPSRSGVVNLHMIKSKGQPEYAYKYLVLDVKGHSKIYLENADANEEGRKTGVRMFGVQWR
ncbi:mitochondrial import inner membrane translocase subunit tim21 [Toensbergia leucococca]|nr:mitochondrial import inner membrane translocase subunit tim21 [Toensbergia leucococca]